MKYISLTVFHSGKRTQKTRYKWLYKQKYGNTNINTTLAIDIAFFIMWMSLLIIFDCFFHFCTSLGKWLHLQNRFSNQEFALKFWSLFIFFKHLLSDTIYFSKAIFTLFDNEKKYLQICWPIIYEISGTETSKISWINWCYDCWWWSAAYFTLFTILVNFSQELMIESFNVRN